jgi:transposase
MLYNKLKRIKTNKMRDKKTNSPQVHQQLEHLTSDVEELRRQLCRKLQQLEELLKILNGQSIIRSEELTSEIDRQINELQLVMLQSLDIF